MKPGIPWSVKGIDDDAKAAAKEAARRSGMTLGAWLNALILKESEGPDAENAPEVTAGRARSTGESPAEMAARLDKLAQKLNALTAEEQETAVSRVMPQPKGSDGDAVLASLISRLEGHERETQQRIGDLVARIEALGRDIANVSETLAKRTDSESDTAGYLALDTALRNVVEHIESSEAKNQSVLEAIQSRLADLGQQSSAAPETAAVTAALAKLEAHVGEIAGELKARLTRTEIEALIYDSANPISSRVDQIDRNAQSLIQRAEAAAAEATRRGLAQADERINQMVREAQAATESEVRLLRATVDALSRHLGEPNAGAQSPSFAELEQRVSELDRRFTDRGPAADISEALADLDQRISTIDKALTAQLAAQRFGPLDDGVGGAVEGRLDDLTRRLETTEGQLSHLQTIEAAITQLYQVLEQNRGQLERAAMGTGGIDEAAAPEIVALAQGLEAVQQAAAESDRRTQETLQAVHETLEQIIGRLAEITPDAMVEEMEADGRAETAPQRPQASPDTTYQGAPWQAEPAAASRQARHDDDPFATTGASWDASPQHEPEHETYAETATERGAEPVAAAVALAEEPPRAAFGQRTGPKWTEAVRAHIAAAAEAGRREPTLDVPPPSYGTAESEAAPESIPDELKVRTDFIAAARRAAQAAAEAGIDLSGPEGAGAGEEPVSRLKSVLQMLKRSSKDPAKTDKSSRKRLILAGILLLAAVSAYALKGRISETPSAQPATPPAASTSAATTSTKTAALEAPVTTATAPAAATAAPSSDPELSLKPVDQPAGPVATASVGLADSHATLGVEDVIMGLPGPEAGPEPLRRAAAAGDPVAQFVVASNYLDERAKKPDFAAAAIWLHKAAQQGLAPAEYRLGTLYERGRGTPLDLGQAALLYDSAARKGNVRAMHNLAVLNTGTSGQADFKVAAYWFGQAAAYGLKDSQFNLAILYERGMGVEQDVPQAYFWYALAARQGDPDARQRTEALKAAVKQQLPEITRKLASWQPLVPDRAANQVAVSDPTWRGAAIPALPPAPAAAPAPAPARSSEAAPVSKEQQVAMVQKMLAQLGFEPGETDGQMGARTANAIRLFQLQHGLPVNGIVSADLIAALQAKAS